MNFNKICIIHLNQIGDLVFSLPLLKALRDNFPGATIHSVVKPYLKELGNTDLRSLCSIIKDASLFVGIDSGIMHLASSLDIPVAGLFGPTDPFYVKPQNDRSIAVRMEEMECASCYLQPCKHRDCMRKLDVKRVMNACTKVLTQSGI